MNFYQFLKKETRESLGKLATIAALSGVANAMLLWVINKAIQAADTDKLNFRNMLMYAAAFTLYIVCQRYLNAKGTRLVETTIANIRIRLADKIRKAELLHLENIGRSAIYNRLTQETTTISNTAIILISALQSITMLIFVTFYVATISKLAFLLIILMLGGAFGIYHVNNKKIHQDLIRSNQTEMDFFSSITDTLEGIKEIKLNNKRSDRLFESIQSVAQSLKKIRIDTAVRYYNNFNFAQSFYFFLIAVIIFILPKMISTYSGVLTQVTAAILFMIGPVISLGGAVQTFNQVNFSIQVIHKLETDLDRMLENYSDPSPLLKNIRSFKQITVQDLRFAFKSADGSSLFQVGPINLEIKTGETIFFVGGNGSGKTTLLKMLCMLYYPDGGRIQLDQTVIDRSQVIYYRELFTSIFSEFHLFKKLYGLEQVNAHTVQDLLRVMALDKKTKFLGDRFSTLDLSAGQRKRLALLITLLEDKPIYIFDEWAADQDPEFRKYFYDAILKKLKEQGKTVLAASHDDRFFGYADRVVKLDFGKIV